MAKPIIVGITGGTCSGKTELSNKVLKELFTRSISASYITHDWFYLDLSHVPKPERDATNFDTPEALDLELFAYSIEQLIHGASVKCPTYDYVEHVRLTNDGNTVDAAQVIIVDGIFLLKHIYLQELFDISVYLNVPDDLRLIRRLRRDVVFYRLSLIETLDYYEKIIRPMHELHVVPSAERATRRLDSWRPGDQNNAVKTIMTSIEEYLEYE